MHIQYSYNSNVSILLVSLLSRASGSLRTTPFHFFKEMFLHLLEVGSGQTIQENSLVLECQKMKMTMITVISCH